LLLDSTGTCARAAACALLCFSFVGWECNPPEPDPAGPQGPPGKILEFDAADIPLPEPHDAGSREGGRGGSDAGMADGSAGSLGSGGSTGSAGSGGAFGTGGSGGHPIEAGSGGSLGTGGSYGGGQRCTGVATSCRLLSQVECALADGCRKSGECTGYSSSCFGKLGSYSCYATKGCYWVSSSGGYCAGSSWSCDLFSGSLSCVDQDGCYWKDTCAGVSTSCSLLSTAQCLDQPGCYLETQ
jgi:hypothetical protein